MKKAFVARLAALLAVVLLLALPAALGEAQPAGDIALEIEIDPTSAPATDAGDTGLSVELEQPDDWTAGELGEIDLPVGDAGEATGEAPQGDPFEGDQVLANAWTEVGYAAVAGGAQVYADAALTRQSGAFPEGATVYVEAIEAGGALLRVRYDTAHAREWGEVVPLGYLAAEDTLRFNDEETAALTAALGKDARTRTVDGVMVPCAAFTAAEYAVKAEEAAQGLGVTARTQAEIQAFADAHPAYTAQVNIYKKAAKDDPYTLGTLSSVNQKSALNLLNQMRYIAGLNANLTLLPEKEEMEAAASLVLRLYGGLSHYPTRPEALSDSAYDDLYNLGYNGASHSNIAMGYTVTGAILAYMADSDADNIGEVGHRRWILNPPMRKTVMGANGRFSAMYIFDQSGSGKQKRVAWPAQQMPVQYFSAEDPWSVSFAMVLDASQIEVDLVRQWDGKTWHFSEAKSDGFFTVDNRSFAQRGCVIFRPDDLDGILIGDVFNVTITDGANDTVTRYTVNFFNLDLSAAAPLARPEVTAVKTDVGNQIGWTAVDRATGYYVCRRTEDSLYAIVADVKGATNYLDKSVSSKKKYYYQVYPHTASVTSPLVSGVEATSPAPKKIKLDAAKTVKLYIDETLQLNTILTPTYAETGLFWNSTNERVAKVDQKGLVKPLATGVTKITVTTDNNLSAKVTIKVIPLPKPSSVKIDAGESIRLDIGEGLKLNAILSPEKAQSKLSWTTSDKKVVKVSGKGNIRAMKEGEATITVKTANGKKAKLTVRVVDPKKPTKVKLDQEKTVRLYIGDTLKLNATLSPDTAVSKLTWHSSDKTVVKVSHKGVLTALKTGKVTITVRTANGKKARVKVKVYTPSKPTKVTLDADATTVLHPGDSLTLKATLAPSSARSALKWRSSNEAVAKVSSKGVVKALKTGTATITVKTANGKKASVKIKVVEE